MQRFIDHDGTVYEVDGSPRCPKSGDTWINMSTGGAPMTGTGPLNIIQTDQRIILKKIESQFPAGSAVIQPIETQEEKWRA